MRPTVLALASLASLAAAQADTGAEAALRLLLERHDVNGDGRIDRDEYPRGGARFARLDRDGDGVVTAADFRPDAARRRPPRRSDGPNPAQLLVGLVDRDGDRRISHADADRWLREADADGDGTLDRAELVAAGVAAGKGRRTFGSYLIQAADEDGDGRLTAAELDALWARCDADGDGELAHLTTRELADRITALPAAEPGLPAPELALPAAANPERTVTLAAELRRWPVVLVFGSHTCPTLRDSAAALAALAARFGDQVGFLLVYVREAHAIDGSAPRWDGPLVEEPITDDERCELARQCASALGLERFTALVDRLDDAACRAWVAAPSRAVLVAEDGTIAWASPPGPAPLRPEALSDAIRAHLARRDRRDR